MGFKQIGVDLPPNENPNSEVLTWISTQRIGIPLLASALAGSLFGTVGPAEIAKSLAALKREGKIRTGFAVRVPSGPLLRKVYNSLDDIEPEVYDAFNRQIPRDELEVLPAFERLGKR